MQKVTLKVRTRPCKTKASLRLEYSPPIPNTKNPNGTRWKTLKGQFLYGKIMDGKFNDKYQHLTPKEKQHNRDTWERCQKIHSKHQNEFLKSEIYSEFELERLALKEVKDLNVFDLYDKKKKNKSISNKHQYNSSKKYLLKFNKSNTDLKLKDITKDYLNDFIESLRNYTQPKLEDRTTSLYYIKLKSILNDFDFLKPILKKVDKIEVDEKEVVFLSKEEIKKLKNQFSDNGILYRITFFMILTGLRISDVKKLKWSELKEDEQGHYISTTIKKTRKQVKNHINSDALKLMGERKNKNDLVFDGLVEDRHREELIDICYNAGIDKHITFHKLRHTFAVHMLEKTHNLMLLKELLHHEDIKSTLVYANIVETTKRETLNNFTMESLDI